MDAQARHVLYVEDHADTRDLVILAFAGLYRVTTSSTIEDALKLAREDDFDLFIIDSWLPDGSGIDLCKRLREFDQRTPIMFYSGAAYEVDKATALNSGAQCYLTKPEYPEVLCSEVGRLIDVFGTNRNPAEDPPVGYSNIPRRSDNKANVSSFVLDPTTAAR